MRTQAIKQTGAVMKAIPSLISRIAKSLMANFVPTLFALVGLIYLAIGVMLSVAAISWFFNEDSDVSISLVDLFVPLFGVALVLLAIGLYQRRRDIWALSIGLLLIFSLLSWAPLSAVETSGEGSALNWSSLIINLILVFSLVLTRHRYRVRGSHLMNASVYRSFLSTIAAIIGGYVLIARWILSTSWTQLRSFDATNDAGSIDNLGRLQLVAVGLLVLAGAVLLFRLLRSLRPDRVRLEAAEAKRILQNHGSDSLDYFILNNKKRQFVWQDKGLIGYDVANGLALVSGNPVCASENRGPLLDDFTKEMALQGLDVAFWAVSSDLATLLEERGLHTVKLGEEASVRVEDFSLDGPDSSGLRRALRAVEAKGVRFAFYRMEDVPGHIYSQMQELDEQWLNEFGAGAAERGFSMTLSRLPEFADRDAAFSVALQDDPAGFPRVVAYISFVPVYNQNSYSLDMMRRTKEAPNGTNEFLLVNTIQITRYHGRRTISLNFAPLAATDGDSSALSRALTALPESVRKSFYLDSLYSFNDKFGPDWVPRYAAFASTRDALGVLRAAAKLEASFEIGWRRRLAQWIAGSEFLITKAIPTATLSTPSESVSADPQ